MVRLIILILVGLMAATGWQMPASAAPSAQIAPAPCAVAAATALAKRAASYVWGAKGPTSFDCSGLIYYSWLQAGVNVGLSTYDQAHSGIQISCGLDNLAGSATTCWQPGDLIFLAYTGGQHVAMYIGAGLFADAYNPATGVIIHDVASDQFYQDNYWQSRRIVSCDGVTVDPGTSSHRLPDNTPGLEDIPNMLAPITFSVAQCGSCNPDGSTILPPGTWSGSWPEGTDQLNLGLMFQTVISWLAFQISEMLRTLICWLLNMLAMLVSFGLAVANSIIYGINGLFKMLVLLWLSFVGWMGQMWLIAESMRDLLYGIQLGLASLADFGRMIITVIGLVASLMGRLIAIFGQLGLTIISLIGWIGGMGLGFLMQLQLSVVGTTVPTKLSDTHIIYRATRGMLEGVRDSQIGWAIYVLWGMAYVWFVVWLSKFLSSSSNSGE